ncbi:MAG: peroxidase-related enzyme [Myxococcales bacterium]|nr:peroxidase-related enzyme [Myxococcales bacterium]
MAWIDVIEPDVATGNLARTYAAIQSARGGIAAVHRVQSQNPRALRAHLELYKSIVFARSSLSRISRERIAVMVSAANGCAYCVAHHGEAARQLGDSPSIVAALSEGQVPQELPQSEQTLLTWAKCAAKQPDQCSETDIQSLKTSGFDDAAILDAAMTVAYFAFVNRLVLLLGVDLEEDFQTTCGNSEDGPG